LKSLFYTPYAVDKTIKKLQTLSELAESIGFKLIHLALAWVIKYEYASSALIGARTLAQLEESLKAIDLLEKFTPEFEGKVNKILDTTPAARMNFLKWTPNPPSRIVASE
jgi:aryl-alcohol dehydrogenase-like predicted oxidoreductase